jgi:hypothetical protein
MHPGKSDSDHSIIMFDIICKGSFKFQNIAQGYRLYKLQPKRQNGKGQFNVLSVDRSIILK